MTIRSIAFTAAVAACTAAAQAQPAPTPRPQLPAGALTGPQVGQPAPPFKLTTIDGKTVTLDSYRGKTLVLNFWATWCPPCRLETPDMLTAYARLHAQGVEFLGVDDTEQAPIVRAFVADKNMPYPQAIDTDKSFSDAYDIRYFPTTFVIDPQGIVRARHVDQVTPALLASFVNDAKAGRNVVLVSPQQVKIDALFASDAGLTFTGDDAAIQKQVKQANDIIDKAEEYVGDSDAEKGNAVDFLRTRTEEAALRDRAIAALAPIATTPAQTALLAVMRGDAARDREQWSDALAQYQAALAIEPKNEDALEGVAFVTGPLKQYADQVSALEKVVSLNSDSVDALLELADAYASEKRFNLAEATNARATSLAMEQLAAKPGDPKLIRRVAATHLAAGRNFAKAGDTEKARDQFDQLVTWTLKLPKTSERYAMYLEEAQEAIAALDLSGPHATTSVSLAPWTGADLPGSIPNTIKYRLVVAGPAGSSVALHTADVPKGWVASFCSDRVCAPFKVSVALPESGVKVIEFQLVPPEGKAPAPKVRVIGTSGAQTSTATT